MSTVTTHSPSPAIPRRQMMSSPRGTAATNAETARSNPDSGTAISPNKRVGASVKSRSARSEAERSRAPPALAEYNRIEARVLRRGTAIGFERLPLRFGMPPRRCGIADLSHEPPPPGAR